MNLLFKDLESKNVDISRCCSINDSKYSKEFCDSNNLIFYNLDIVYRFNYKIFYPFINNYCLGITPIPCINCNSEIKIGFLKYISIIFNCYLSTGHYSLNYTYKGINTFYRSLDNKKDQTYFLYNIKNVSHLFFPLGNIFKSETRKLAKKIRISIYKKKDSNEICFIGNNEYWFLIINKYGTFFKGKILNIDGKIIGFHEGIFKYTINQRKKIGFFLNKKIFVFKKDFFSCNLIVSEKKYLFSSLLLLYNISIIIPLIEWPEILLVKTRSTGKLYFSKWKFLNNNIIYLFFFSNLCDLSEGQSLAFYYYNFILGGAVIKKNFEKKIIY